MKKSSSYTLAAFVAASIASVSSVKAGDLVIRPTTPGCSAWADKDSPPSTWIHDGTARNQAFMLKAPCDASATPGVFYYSFKSSSQEITVVDQVNGKVCRWGYDGSVFLREGCTMGNQRAINNNHRKQRSAQANGFTPN